MFFADFMSRVGDRLLLVVIIAVPLISGLAILMSLIKDIARPRSGEQKKDFSKVYKGK